MFQIGKIISSPFNVKHRMLKNMRERMLAFKLQVREKTKENNTFFVACLYFETVGNVTSATGYQKYLHRTV
jgi:hypothetical protein